MFCNKCGAEIDINDKFCNSCGEKIENKDIGSIIFKREKQYYGCIVSIKVFMDGNLVATLNSNTEVTVNTTIGKHKIMFDLWSGNGAEEIEITKEHPNVKVTFKLKMGVVTTKPQIIKIENI